MVRNEFHGKWLSKDIAECTIRMSCLDHATLNRISSYTLLSSSFFFSKVSHCLDKYNHEWIVYLKTGTGLWASPSLQSRRVQKRIKRLRRSRWKAPPRMKKKGGLHLQPKLREEMTMVEDQEQNCLQVVCL